MSWIGALVEWLLSLLTGKQDPNNDKVIAIQARAVAACGFLPMYDSVIQLLSTAFPPAVAVSVVAGSICKAVNDQGVTTVATLADTGAASNKTQWLMVNGVKVEGAKVK